MQTAVALLRGEPSPGPKALTQIRSFVAKFKSVANQGKEEPTRVVGTLHTDNAGEFLSRQFEELLADETMEHTRCPALTCTS